MNATFPPRPSSGLRRNKARIEVAFSARHHHAPPQVVHDFGRDAAERRHVLGRTLSSAIAIDGPALSATKTAKDLALDVDDGEAGFRRLSRVRHVYRPALLCFPRAAPREGRDYGDRESVV